GPRLSIAIRPATPTVVRSAAASTARKPGNLGGEALAEGGVLKLAAELALEPSIGNAFAGQPALGIGGVLSRRQVPAQPAGEPLEERQLGHRLVVGRIINTARLAMTQCGNHRTGHVVPMNHVQEPLSASLDPGLAAEELLQPIAAAGPIDAGNAEDD